jgi:thioredoxin 1
MIRCIKFSADWCGPCKRLKPVWEGVVKDIKDVDFTIVDVDADPALAAQYKILSIPTIVFLKDGVETGRMIGLTSEKAIRDAIDKLR